MSFWGVIPLFVWSPVSILRHLLTSHIIMQNSIMDCMFHPIAFGKGGATCRGKKEPSLILYSSNPILLGIKHCSGRHIWWNASHQISIRGIGILSRPADNSPSNVLLFRLLKKLESQISCEMSDTNGPAQILKVKIKETGVQIGLAIKAAPQSPRRA